MLCYPCRPTSLPRDTFSQSELCLSGDLETSALSYPKLFSWLNYFPHFQILRGHTALALTTNMTWQEPLCSVNWIPHTLPPPSFLTEAWRNSTELSRHWHGGLQTPGKLSPRSANPLRPSAATADISFGLIKNQSFVPSCGKKSINLKRSEKTRVLRAQLWHFILLRICCF